MMQVTLTELWSQEIQQKQKQCKEMGLSIVLRIMHIFFMYLKFYLFRIEKEYTALKSKENEEQIELRVKHYIKLPETWSWLTQFSWVVLLRNESYKYFSMTLPCCQPILSTTICRLSAFCLVKKKLSFSFSMDELKHDWSTFAHKKELWVIFCIHVLFRYFFF
jgi:hypothetical protein